MSSKDFIERLRQERQKRLDKQSNENVKVTSKSHSKKQFTEVVKPNSNSKKLTEAKSKKQYTEVQIERNLARVVAFFNKHFASVYVKNHHRILAKQVRYESNSEKVIYEYFQQDEWLKGYQNKTMVIDTEGRRMNIAKAWLLHRDCAVYRGGVGFTPVPYGSHRRFPKGYFNLWKGFKVEPANIKSDTFELIINHIVQVICGGNSELIEYFFNWVAYTLQNPNKPAGVAVVVRGLKGSGKGIIGHFLKGLWGNHGLYVTSQKHLTGTFNAHLADTCFLFADEAFYSGDEKHESILKSLITEPVLMIERKGIDAVEQSNYLKIYMATNSEYVVPATRDERRFCVLDAQDTYKGNKAYFDALTAACHDERNQQLFLHLMLNEDLSDFDLGQIPETQALKDQRYNSLSSAGKWFFECLKNGSIDNAGWRSKMATEEYFSEYSTWCKTNGILSTGRLSSVALSAYLGKIGFKEDKNIAYRGRKARGRVFGSLNDAVDIFEKFERVKVNY